MQAVIVRMSIGAAVGALLISGRPGQAQTSPGMNALFTQAAYGNPGAATAQVSVAPPLLTLAPARGGNDATKSVDSSPMSRDSADDRRSAQPNIATTPLSLAPDNAAASPESTLTACACGCGIFEVGTSSMFPEGQGGTFFLEYDFQNQSHNWSGNSRAPAANNADKDIRTHFITAGLQYMFSRTWGFQVEVPYDIRHFQTTGGATGNDPVTLDWGALGDIRIEGIYTGFFPDLSAGMTFGFKLPTGNFKHNDAFGDIDRDSEIGTGSTDALIGGFYRHEITADHSWTWFAQLNADLPAFTQDSYRPGIEIDGALGVYYSGFSIGKVNIVPVGQVLASERTSDSGANAAHPVASGFQRLILSPGIEFHFHPFMVYGDVEVPVYQYMTGNQLVAPVMFKVMMSYSF